jgi:hypothetical protein
MCAGGDSHTAFVGHSFASEPTMLWIFVTILWLLLLTAPPAAICYFMLPAGRRCARCGEWTIRFQPDVWMRLLPLVVVRRRMCLSCGWSGLTRRRPRSLPRIEFTGLARPEPGLPEPGLPVQPPEDSSGN